MAELTVVNYLGALQADPWDEGAYDGLRGALLSGDPGRLGEDHVRHLEFARGTHEGRGECYAAARLIEIELEQAGEEDPDFASALWKELGRLRREELLDDAGASAAYARALELRPGDEEVQEALQQVRQTKDRWRELVKHFKAQARDASDAPLKASLLVRAGGLVWQYQTKGKNKEVDKLFREAVRTDPQSVRAVRLYEITLRARKKYGDLAKLLSSARLKSKDRADRLGLSLSAARLYDRELDDKEQAAECYAEVLDFDPSNKEAMGFMAGYFTEREMWDHLVSLYEDVLRSRRLAPEAEAGTLLQIAMVHWRMRGAPDKAEPYFERLRKLAPAQPVMLEFFREQLGGTEEDGKLLSVLGAAQRAADSEDDKARVALELARLAASKDGAIERAIDAYKAVLGHDPENQEARRAIKDLYRRAGKWNALVETLRGELDAAPESDIEGRLAILRELLPLYRDELSLEAMVLGTYASILELDPQDSEALEALVAAYSKAGRWNELIPLLQSKADASQDPDEKAALLVSIAGLWIDHFSNYNQATRPLEQVLELQPDNRGALERLREIYTKKRSWKPLFGVLQKELELVEDETDRRAKLVELARLATDRLSAYEDAIGLWKRALEIDPNDPEGFTTLERLAERAKDWQTLADVLERRADEETDKAAKIKLLTRLGTLLGERAGDPGRASGAWRRILEIDPKHGRALRTLRESFIAARDFEGLEALYAESGDYEGLVEVLGNAADRAEDAETRIALSFRAAELYEQDLGAPQRAFRAYERVLSADPSNQRAAAALLPIYREEDKWPKAAGVLEVLLSAEQGEARLPLLLELIDLCVDRLKDGERAYRYATEAYTLSPDADGVQERLMAAVELTGKHDGLVALLSERAEREGGERGLDLRREAARIALEKQGRADEAAKQLLEVLKERPGDTETSALLESIYRAEGNVPELRSLLRARVEHTEDLEDKRRLLGDLAMLEEELLDDPEAAAQRYREIHEIDPGDSEALAALDRLADAAGRHDELLEVLRQRVEISADPSERAALLLRLGHLCAGPLSDPRSAIDAYAEVLAAEPNQSDAIAALESIAEANGAFSVEIGRLLEPVYAERSDSSKLLAVLQQRLSATEDAEERRALGLQVADVAEELGDASTAFGALDAVLRAYPDERDLWDRVGELADRAGKQQALADLYAKLIDAEGMDEDGVRELSERTASLYDDSLGKPGAAEAFHVRVMALDPGAERAFEALKDLYTTQERWDDLKALYRERIEYTSDGDAKLDLLLQVCFLHEELLDDVEGAIHAYQQVLELEPAHAASRRALERLYTRVGRYRDLLQLLEGDLADAAGKESIELMYRLGELHEQKLEEPGLAVDRYAAVLEEQPTHLRAQEALERMLPEPEQRQRIARLLEPLYEGQGAYPELVRVLEVQLEELEEPGERVALLLRVAEVIGTQLRDPEAAFNTLLRALTADAADGVVREQLAAVAQQAGRERERATALESAIDATEEAFVKAEILRELAELYDEQLGDAKQAEGAYTRLIQVDGDNPESVLLASRALERLHGASADYPALAKDLRRQIDVDDDPESKRSLLTRLAELTEQQLLDPAGAIEVHNERLELDPGDRDALVTLSRLYDESGRWRELIDVLRRRDQDAEDEQEARLLLRRAGEIQETKLHDLDAAVATYTEVNDRFGADRETLGRLLVLFEQRQQWNELLEALRADLELVDEPAERMEIRFRAAELMRTRTAQVDDAIEALREMLLEEPDHQGALAALLEIAGSDLEQRVEAARTLVPHYEAQADHAMWVRMLEVVADSDDVPEAIASLRQAASVAEGQLDDSRRAFDLVRRGVTQALSEPDLAELLDELHRLAGKSLRWSEYGAFLREIAADVLDEDQQLACLLRAAQSALDHDGDVELARRYFGKVLEVRPDDRAALDALQTLLEAAHDHEALLEVLQRKTEVVDTPEERVALLREQAELCAGPLGDAEMAIRAYEEVLEEQPSAGAFGAVEALYRQTRRFDDLAAMYERQLDLEVGDGVEVRHRLGALHQNELGAPEQALEVYRDVIELSPDHPATNANLEKLLESESLRGAAAELLEPYFLRHQAWQKLVVALEAQLDQVFAADDRKPLLMRLGELQEVQLEDLDAAFEVHVRMFRDNPLDAEVIDHMERLARVLEQPERVAKAFEAELAEEGVADDDHVELAVRAAEIRERGGEPESARRLYEQALAFDPQRKAVAAALERVLSSSNSTDALATLYRSQADVADNDERRVEMLHRLAVLSEKDMSDPAGAVTVLQEILAIAPTDEKALASIDRLLVAQSRWEDLAEHVRHCIDHAESGSQALELKIRLGGILYEHLEDVDGAVDLLEEITQEDPSYPPALQTLEGLMEQPQLRPRVSEILQGLYEGASDWQKLVRVYERRLEIEQDKGERIRILGDIARQYEEAGKLPQRALSAWARAFVLDPSDAEPRAEVERLAEQLGAWDALVQTYERALGAASEDFLRASLLAAMARVHDAQRGDPRAAIATYERLLSVESDDPEPLAQLESLYTMVGDWRGLLDVCQRKFERSFDPIERAELARRAGALLEDLLEDVHGAIDAYQRALTEVEDDEAALTSLDRLYTQVEDWDNLANVLGQRLQFAVEPAVRVDAATRLGEVLSVRLDRRVEAIDAYVRVLEDEPGSRGAVEALGKLYAQEEMWAELLDNLRVRAEMAEDESERVVLTFEAARVLERRLADTFEAVETYRAVLELDPQHEASIEALMALGQHVDHRQQVQELLMPLLREHERWDPLAELMARAVGAELDPFEQQRLLLQLAEVHERGRGDLPAAFERACEALVLDADEPGIAEEVERLAAATGGFARAADALAQRARATTDDMLAREHYERLAAMAERELADVPRAIDALVQAAERSGGDPGVLAELDRLYASVSAWPELAGVLERRIEQETDDGAAADLFVRLAELRAKRFADGPGALSAYRDALDRSPLDPRAVSALEGMLTDDVLALDAVETLDGVYRQAGDLQRVAELFDTKVRLAETRGEKVALLQELAGLWERDLGQAAPALEALRRAFALDPLDNSTVDEMERVAAAGAGFEGLRGVVESVLETASLDRPERRDLALRAARWYAEQLGDLEAGERCYRLALEADLDCVEAHEGLIALLRSQDRTSDLIAALSNWAERESDEGMALERLLEAGSLAEQSGRPEDAIEQYKRAYHIDPGCVSALDQLIRIREAESSWSHVAELLDHRIDAELDGETRVALRHRAANVRLELKQDPAEAERLYRANLEDDATDLASMDVLGQIYEKAERWDELRELLERRLDVVDTVEDRVTVRVRLASLAERQFGQRDDAIEQLNEVLMDVPDHAEAIGTLQRLLTDAERWEDVGDLLERSIDLARDKGDTARELDLRVRQGELFEKHLDSADRAIDTFEQVLEREPGHVGALRALVRLNAKAGDAARGADMLERLLDRTEGEELVDTALQLAEISEESLQEPERAEAALRRALGAGTRTVEVQSKLAGLLERSERHDALAELLERQAEEVEAVEEKVVLLQRTADLYAKELGDPGRAAACLERAVRLAPDDRAVLLPLCDLYIAAGRQGDAIPVLEQIIASYSGRRAREVATYHHRLGRAHLGMGEKDKALAELDAAFRIDLTNVGILVDLGMLCHEMGQLERAQKTFRALLLQKLDADARLSKADVYYYLGDIASQLGDKLKAVSMLERAVAEQRDHERARELLGRLKG